MTRWYGKLLGFVAGFLLMRSPVGGVIGMIIGHAFDADWFRLGRNDPYRVLNLTREATDAEIDQAYRRLISQYHPDKMGNAADEERRQAERKAGEINAAYDRIKAMRKR
ncbi:MAG TPA: J domain-containing protein [Pseudoxanthomonas sp.]|nr:J domain-containing protein [Pseudoxanthomonas sp.]